MSDKRDHGHHSYFRKDFQILYSTVSSMLSGLETRFL